jgi:hypothetical protein
VLCSDYGTDDSKIHCDGKHDKRCYYDSYFASYLACSYASFVLVHHNDDIVEQYWFDDLAAIHGDDDDFLPAD